MYTQIRRTKPKDNLLQFDSVVKLLILLHIKIESITSSKEKIIRSFIHVNEMKILR